MEVYRVTEMCSKKSFIYLLCIMSMIHSFHILNIFGHYFIFIATLLIRYYYNLCFKNEKLSEDCSRPLLEMLYKSIIC